MELKYVIKCRYATVLNNLHNILPKKIILCTFITKNEFVIYGKLRKQGREKECKLRRVDTNDAKYN